MHMYVYEFITRQQNGKPNILHRCRRFNEKLITNTQWIREQTHEHYAKHYSIHYHFDEPLAGRNVITDVLHKTLADDGCFYQFKGGWERPGWFNQKKPALVSLDNLRLSGFLSYQNNDMPL